MLDEQDKIAAAFEAAQEVDAGTEAGGDWAPAGPDWIPDDPGAAPDMDWLPDLPGASSDAPPSYRSDGPGGMPPPYCEAPRPPEAEGVEFPLNDYGNGLRVHLYYGEDLLFVPRLGWHRWDGRRWAVDEDMLAVRELAQQISGRIEAERFHIAAPEEHELALTVYASVKEERARLLQMPKDERTAAQDERRKELDALAAEDDRARKALAKLRSSHLSHAKASGNSSRISNMLTEAAPKLAVSVDDLNARPLDLCCQNGVVSLQVVEDAHAAEWGGSGTEVEIRLRPHAREQRITKMVAAEYRPDAPRKVFEAFLARVVPDDEIRAFLKRWFGYSLTGETGEQKLAFLYGHGRNGKSTLVELIARIMADYGTTIPIESLTGSEQRKGSDATPDLVRLPGARMVRASEPEQGQKLRESLIKAMTGGENMLVRRMMQEFIEIKPQFKLTISGNYKPEIRGADDGIWRRIMLVPFEEKISEDEVDPRLISKLWAERDGVLAWMIEGAVEWLQTGLRPPASIAQATEEYRRESDPVRLFLETECEITGSEDHSLTAKYLGDAFNAWLVNNGGAAWGPRATGMALKKRAETVRGEGGRRFWLRKSSTNYYFGVKLRPEAQTLAEVYVAQKGGGPVTE